MGFTLTYEMKQILWEMSLWVLFTNTVVIALAYLIPWLWEKTKWIRADLRQWIGFKIRQYKRRQRIKHYYRMLNKIDPPTFRPPYWDGRRGWR